MTRRKRRPSKAFSRLASRVTREYERKGYSKKRARYIGRATAGEVATRKHRRRAR